MTSHLARTAPELDAAAHRPEPLARRLAETMPHEPPIQETVEIGFVGLGRIGGKLARRLVERCACDLRAVAFNRSPAAVRAAERAGAVGASSLDDLVRKLDRERPRVVWLMVPAGEPTDQVLGALAERFDRRDVLIAGGNSHYTDTLRRAEELAARGLRLLDVGTSGGIWGRDAGYTLMAGGPPIGAVVLKPVGARRPGVCWRRRAPRSRPPRWVGRPHGGQAPPGAKTRSEQETQVLGDRVGCGRRDHDRPYGDQEERGTEGEHEASGRVIGGAEGPVAGADGASDLEEEPERIVRRDVHRVIPSTPAPAGP
jgi:hypothetical protein